MKQPEWPLGPPLRARRNAAGLSQVQAARLAGISTSKWRQLEDGYTKTRSGRQEAGTTPETVAKAARAVRWDVAEALAVAGYDPHGHVELVSQMASPPGEPDVLPGFSQLTPATQQALRALVDSLTGRTGTGVGATNVTLDYGNLPSDALQRGRPVAYSADDASTQAGEP